MLIAYCSAFACLVLLQTLIFENAPAKLHVRTYMSFHELQFFSEKIYIIESVDSISRDERDVPLTQYITNA